MENMWAWCVNAENCKGSIPSGVVISRSVFLGPGKQLSKLISMAYFSNVAVSFSQYGQCILLYGIS